MGIHSQWPNMVKSIHQCVEDQPTRFQAFSKHVSSDGSVSDIRKGLVANPNSYTRGLPVWIITWLTISNPNWWPIQHVTRVTTHVPMLAPNVIVCDDGKFHVCQLKPILVALNGCGSKNLGLGPNQCPV